MPTCLRLPRHSPTTTRSPSAFTSLNRRKCFVPRSIRRWQDWVTTSQYPSGTGGPRLSEESRNLSSRLRPRYATSGTSSRAILGKGSSRRSTKSLHLSSMANMIRLPRARTTTCWPAASQIQPEWYSLGLGTLSLNAVKVASFPYFGLFSNPQESLSTPRVQH